MKLSYSQRPDYDSVITVGGKKLCCYSPRQFAKLSRDEEPALSGSCSLSKSKAITRAVSEEAALACLSEKIRQNCPQGIVSGGDCWYNISV